MPDPLNIASPPPETPGDPHRYGVLQEQRVHAESLWQQAEQLVTSAPDVSFGLRLQALHAWTGWTYVGIGQQLGHILQTSAPSESAVHCWMVGKNLPGGDGGKSNIFDAMSPPEAFDRLVHDYEDSVPPEVLAAVGGGFLDVPGRRGKFTQAYASESTRRDTQRAGLQNAATRDEALEAIAAQPDSKGQFRLIRAETLWKRADAIQETVARQAFGLRLRAVRELAGTIRSEFAGALQPLLTLEEPLAGSLLKEWEDGKVVPSRQISRDTLIEAYTRLANQAEKNPAEGKFLKQKAGEHLTRRGQLAQSYDRAVEEVERVPQMRSERHRLREAALRERSEADALASVEGEAARYAAIAERRARQRAEEPTERPTASTQFVHDSMRSSRKPNRGPEQGGR